MFFEVVQVYPIIALQDIKSMIDNSNNDSDSAIIIVPHYGFGGRKFQTSKYGPNPQLPKLWLKVLNSLEQLVFYPLGPLVRNS